MRQTPHQMTPRSSTYCCCFKRTPRLNRITPNARDSPLNDPSRRANTMHESRPLNRNNQSFGNLRHRPGGQTQIYDPRSFLPASMVQPQEPEIIPAIQINQHLDLASIKMLERQPLNDEKSTYRYLCPICFRYFNNIYQFMCCENYVCNHCVIDLDHTMLVKKVKTASCCFCRKEKPYITPVDFDQESRKYEDTKTPVKLFKNGKDLKTVNSKRARQFAKSEAKKYQVQSAKFEQSLDEDGMDDEILEETQNKFPNPNMPSKFAYSLNMNQRANTS